MRRPDYAGIKGIDGMPAIKSPDRGHAPRRAMRWGCLAMLPAALLTASPSFAQKIHSYEPLMMDPHSTIYVDDGSCSEGKVLKVQGAPNNQRPIKA